MDDGGRAGRNEWVSNTKPVYTVLQVCGLYRTHVDVSDTRTAPDGGGWGERDGGGRAPRCGGWWRTVCRLYWPAHTVLVMSLYAYCSYFTLRLWHYHANASGVLNLLTVCSVITGVKPMIALANCVLFALRHGTHAKLLSAMDYLRADMLAHYQHRPDYGRKVRRYVLAVAAVALPVTAASVAEEYYVGRLRFSRPFPINVGLLLVPLISLVDLLPLCYFYVVQATLNEYCRVLVEQTDRRVRRGVLELRPFYERFIAFTKVQRLASKLFGAWLLFGTAWSLVTLCLTLYFVNYARTSSLVPASLRRAAAEQTDRGSRLRVVITLNMMWTTMQVLAALINVALVCYCAIRSNELVRTVTGPLIKWTARRPDDPHLFLVSNVFRKLQTQELWGLTAWRTFGFDRPVIFTMVSGVVSFYFVMVKMRPDEPP